MSYASLMVHVDVEADVGGRVEIATDLAERFRAHPIGIAACAPMAVFSPDKPRNDPSQSDRHLQDTGGDDLPRGRHARLARGNAGVGQASFLLVGNAPAVATESERCAVVDVDQVEGRKRGYFSARVAMESRS